jgi:hypothetical protein
MLRRRGRELVRARAQMLLVDEDGLEAAAGTVFVLNRNTFCPWFPHLLH